MEKSTLTTNNFRKLWPIIILKKAETVVELGLFCINISV
jgi:hypothetical protein